MKILRLADLPRVSLDEIRTAESDELGGAVQFRLLPAGDMLPVLTLQDDRAAFAVELVARSLVDEAGNFIPYADAAKAVKAMPWSALISLFSKIASANGLSKDEAAPGKNS